MKELLRKKFELWIRKRWKKSIDKEHRKAEKNERKFKVYFDKARQHRVAADNLLEEYVKKYGWRKNEDTLD